MGSNKKMKTILLLLAICASAYTMRSLSTLNGQPQYFGNPWANSEKGSCPEYERLFNYQDKNYPNMKFAICGPIIGGNLHECPRAETFDKGTDSYNTMDTRDSAYRLNKHFCVEECSHARDACAEGATCVPAPHYLQNHDDQIGGTVKNICSYGKGHFPPPPPPGSPLNYYESPWIKDAINGACNKKDYKQRYYDEKVWKQTINGVEYGMCMPEQDGDSSSCPMPPMFHHGADGLDSKDLCYAECSHGSCAPGAECMDAPQDIVVGDAKQWLHKVCMWRKPATSTVRVVM